MQQGIRVCKVCGVEYPYCKTENRGNRFRYQDVACCPEHGSIYFAKIIESRDCESSCDTEKVIKADLSIVEKCDKTNDIMVEKCDKTNDIMVEKCESCNESDDEENDISEDDTLFEEDFSNEDEDENDI